MLSQYLLLFAIGLVFAVVAIVLSNRPSWLPAAVSRIGSALCILFAAIAFIGGIWVLMEGGW